MQVTLPLTTLSAGGHQAADAQRRFDDAQTRLVRAVATGDLPAANAAERELVAVFSLTQPGVADGLRAEIAYRNAGATPAAGRAPLVSRYA